MTRGGLGEPRVEEPVERRDFLGLAATWSFFGTLVVAILGAMRLPVPAVFPETDSRFAIGRPEQFSSGTAVHLPRRRIWIFADDAGVAAVSTICPHLGCIVKRQQTGAYLCPCHGASFDATGNVVSGPSPRGLVWLEVFQAPDGRLGVDSAREVDPSVRFRA